MPSRNGAPDKKRRREGALDRLERRRGLVEANKVPRAIAPLTPQQQKDELARIDLEIKIVRKRVGK